MMIRRRSAAWHEREFNKRWGDLAAYNAENARGLMHRPSWQAKMRRKQERYNEISQRGGDDIWTCDLEEVCNV